MTMQENANLVKLIRGLDMDGTLTEFKRSELLQSSKGVNSYRVPLKRLKAGAGSLRFLSQGKYEAPQSRRGLPARNRRAE